MSKKQRPRVSKYVQFAKAALWFASQEFEPYSHPKSPRTYTQPQLVACLLLMHRLDISYRDMEEWLYASDKVVAALGLKSIPTYSALARANQRLLTLGKMDRLNAKLLEKMGVEEEVVVIDATGFRMTQASRHYISRKGNQHAYYWKGFYAVGLKSRYILARSQCIGPSHDGSKLEPLRRAVRPFMRSRRWLLMADGGFDVASVRQHDLIPPRRTGVNRSIVAPKRRTRADLVDYARLTGLFGQRWQIESVISVIKRKFGDAIRARRHFMQRREPAIKMLVYNIYH